MVSPSKHSTKRQDAISSFQRMCKLTKGCFSSQVHMSKSKNAGTSSSQSCNRFLPTSNNLRPIITKSKRNPSWSKLSSYLRVSKLSNQARTLSSVRSS